MAKDIKVKKEKKGDIKQLNRNVVGIQKVKNEIIKSRNEITEISNKNEKNNSSNEIEYATNKISNNIKTASAIGIDKYNEYGKKSVVESKNNIVKVKDNIDLIKIRYAQNKMIKQKEMKKYSIRNTEFENEEIENTRIELKKNSIKLSENIKQANKEDLIKLAENIKQVNKEDEVISLKTNSKNNNIKIKNNVIANAPKGKNENFIKTIQKSENPIIKTSTSKENIIGNTTTQKIATQINKAKDKIINDTKNIKRVLQKLYAGLKALAKGSKALVIALFAGGWIFGLIIIIIMLVGLFCSSTFGIFFANEGVDGGKPLKQVVREINTEFSKKIQDIQNSVPHDDYSITSKRAKIKDVIAIYAVKVSGADDGQEVITMTPEKEEIFKKIFWDMNKIDYITEIQKESHIEKDKKGKDKVVTISKTILHISITSKTAYEMADQYNFNRKQRQQLDELLSEKYASLWSSLLYGSSGGNTAIVEVAESQIGNVGGQPYWSWYGFTSRVSWCACFVSWCANECGFIDSGVIPKFAACQDQGISWFQACGLWQDRGYMANPGDIIFFDWEHDGHSDHVGIVEYVQDGVVHTIEGNTNDSCARREYLADSLDICGYGTPMY